MTPFVQATGSELMVSTLLPASADVRAEVLDPLRMTPEQAHRLNGNACARCGGTDGLRPGGLACTASGPDGIGRLAWHVQVCRHHAATGGTVVNSGTVVANYKTSVKPRLPNKAPGPAARSTWHAGRAGAVRIPAELIHQVERALSGESEGQP